MEKSFSLPIHCILSPVMNHPQGAKYVITIS